MAESSPRLALPYMMPSQAQKHVTFNEALQVLDCVVQLSVAAIGTTIPPAAPEEGEAYVTGANPTGEWAGHAGAIAVWGNAAWVFFAPQPGWRLWDRAAEELRIWDGAAWRLPLAEMQNLDGVGINTGADATNRLAVRAAASLFTHEGAGHQIKLNKAAGAETASVLYQTDWSGRAEFGTTGDDDFHIKVSADGTVWTESIVLDRVSGQMRGAAVQSSALDAASGKLMRTGAFGVGQSQPVADIAALRLPGFYNGVTGTTGAPLAAGTRWSFLELGGPSTGEGVKLAFQQSLAKVPAYVARYSGNILEAWYQLFHQGSVLGSVAQTGGVPTGALIERGANANGAYTRFADGMQICQITGFGTANGAGTTWTFPALFSNAPTIAGSITSGSVLRLFTTKNRTPSSVAIHTFDATGSEAVSPACDLVAIGNWF